MKIREPRKAIQEAFEELSPYYETNLRNAVRLLWNVTLPEFRPNIQARFESGLLTHQEWANAKNCTCLFGAVQPLTARTYDNECEIASRYTTLRPTDSYIDDITLRDISNSWENFVIELGWDDRPSRSSEAVQSRFWNEVYLQARAVVLDELARIQASAYGQQETA